MSSLDTLLLSYRIYRSFPIYSNVILISYQGVRWISSSVEFFIFIFFLQACRLQTLRLRYPTIFLSYSRSTSRYYNTNECFSQYKWNFIIFTIIRKWNVHTVISNPWSSTTRFQKKRREKKRTEIPRGQPSDSILPLSKGWHNAWRCKPRSRPARGAFRLVLLPLSCSRAPEQAQPGEPVSSVLPVFSTPPSPPLPPIVRYTTTRSNFSPWWTL